MGALKKVSTYGLRKPAGAPVLITDFDELLGIEPSVLAAHEMKMPLAGIKDTGPDPSSTRQGEATRRPPSSYSEENRTDRQDGCGKSHSGRSAARNAARYTTTGLRKPPAAALEGWVNARY